MAYFRRVRNGRVVTFWEDVRTNLDGRIEPGMKEMQGDGIWSF